MKIKQYITLFIALFFLGLFFSKAQSNDSTAFKAAQDSTDINSFLSGTINNNPFWKQQVLSNQGGAVLNLSLSTPLDYYNYKTNGYNSYIPLSKNLDYSRTYKYTRIEYRPTLSEGQFISALHTQSYKDFSFGLYYQKLVSEGEFKNEKKDHINTEFRFNYHPLNKNFKSFFSLFHNVSKVLENGGFLSDSLYINQASVSNIGLPVQLDRGSSQSARNEINNTQFKWTNEYNFFTKDSLRIKLISNSIYHSKSEHYIDDNLTYVSNDWDIPDVPDYYSNFYNSTEQTNDSIGFRSFKQTFGVNSTYKQFELEPYIELEKNYFQLGYGKQDINLYKLGLKYKALKGKLFGQFVLKNQNDFESGILAKSDFNLNKNITFRFNYDERTPDLFLRKYESNHFRWDNDFSRTSTLNLEAEVLVLNKTTKVNINYKTISNYTFLNEEALAVQSDENQAYGSIEVNSLLKKGRFTFNGQLLLQRVGENDLNTESKIINIPTFVGRLKVAYKQKMFGDALVQPGIQINYNSKYFAPRYMAATSSFYLQNEQKVGGAFLLDVFVNVKISTFTIYAMYNNILQNVFLEENFTSPNYIGPIQQFNFGIRWNFYD